MSAPPGAPTKLTPGKAKSIIKDVSLGLFDAQNAMKHGIHFATLRSWIDRGLDEEAEEPYKSFAEGYIKAAIALEERVIATVLQAADDYKQLMSAIEEWEGPASGGAGETEFTQLRGARKVKEVQTLMRGDWRAAAWYAERRWPLRWGSRAPESGPKELMVLPDAPVMRRDKVRAMVKAPPPELIKAFRDAGYELVRRKSP